MATKKARTTRARPESASDQKAPPETQAQDKTPIDVLDERVTALQGALALEMNAAKDIFRALLQVQAQIKAELVEARERISAGAAFAARVNDSVFRVDDALTLTTSDIEGDIALLAVDATDQEERLDEHDEALDLNTGSIASLSDSVGSLASSLSAVSKRIESHIEDAVQHRARWSTTRDSVYTMRSALISLGGRLDRLERTAIKNPFVRE